MSVTAPGTNGTATTGSGGTTTTGTGTTTTTGTGTTTTTPTVSQTPVGELVGGVSGLSPFAIVGVIDADGAGNLSAAAFTGATLTKVGTYTVNPDCTISVTLTDAFVGVPLPAPGTSGTTTTGTTGTTGTTTGTTGATTNSGGTNAPLPTPATVTLQGLVLNGGAEIDLAQIGTSSTGVSITLRRALQSIGTCTDNNVKGPFGVVTRAVVVSTSTGTTGTATTGTSGSPTPSTLIGRFVADGAGNLTTDTLGSQSALPDLQLTGTYSVNGDCSGTIQFVDSTGATHSGDFVIVQANSSTPMSNGPQNIMPELLIGFTDQGVNGFGVAKEE